jgi:ATP-binding cassette subfamily B protein IrtA
LAYTNKGYKEKTAYYFKARSRMNSVIIEYVRAIPVMKVFGKGTEQFALYREAVEELVSFGKKWAYQSLRAWAVFMSFLSNAVLPVLALGIYLYLHQGISPGVFILFLILGGGYIKPLFGLSNLTTELIQINTGVRNMDEFLDAPEQEVQGIALQPTDFSIAFHNASFAYGTAVKALDGVSCKIPQGSITAFVGPSGSGKSTAAQLIARFWDVESGSVCIGGVDCRQIPVEDLMRMVSFVFQDSFMFQETIFENIRMGMEKSEQEVMEAAKAARCDDFIRRLPDGYQTRWGEHGIHLSGGEQQRIQIARAILKNAPILILDEATAFADPDNEYQLQQAIGRLISGKTVIIIAHRLSTITDADQILVFDRGKIIACGKHHELIDNSELYQRMWQAHIQSKDFKLINEKP